MPMIDYEDDVPVAVDDLYRSVAGDFRARGSRIMLGASHLARQMLWLESAWPDAFRHARYFLGLPQYWAWRLSGVAASELTVLGAQSHLWTVPERHFAPIVHTRGWAEKLPPILPAWATLGPLRPNLVLQTGLSSTTRVLCGIHDSSANFYRYQCAGLRDLTVVSTGTWIVALSDQAPLARLDEARGICCNADLQGNKLAGALCMGGREFALVAGQQPPGAQADATIVAGLIRRGRFAVPCFGEEDGLLPGRARRGRFVGDAPANAAERLALAVLLVALLTDYLLDALSAVGDVVLDGTFCREPLYPSLVAGLRRSARVRCDLHGYGSAAGAALLAGHTTRSAPAPLMLQTVPAADLAELADYRARWRLLLTETE